MSTAFHARYFAYELTRHHRGSGVGTALFDACVKLHPHQIDAAVFALRNPLSSGTLLADEVGLGKTIEAGLVLCQLWAEKRRRLLIICPASLRKQWSLELQDKFNLPNIVIDSKTKDQIEQRDRVVIMSYNFASRRADDLRAIPFDLVVVDEAHKLRNVFKQTKGMAQNIKTALNGRRKVLLTATPLQNSLLELFGLSSILSDEIFGDLDAFKARYSSTKPDLEGLQSRLQPFCKRTLRADVLEYVPYTARHPMTFRFWATDEEHKLYEAISVYLMREDSLALPEKGRGLIEMVVRKLLASSAPAVAQTLEKMRGRLERLRNGIMNGSTLQPLFDEDDLPDEYDEEFEQILSGEDPPTPEDGIDRKKLDEEIADLSRFAQWARGISVDTKSRKLLEALRAGFDRMDEMSPPAPRKALIFTESRRTQEYLKNFLDANGYAGRITLFNGSNSDPDSKRTIDRWIEANRETGRASGSRVVDSRTALIEYFRDEATIMLATEAAAEGVNLQFCSLVVNYDLPWNPQRIEQRIGRCHRYGQKHDVVVINFLNERNHADVRVHELLENKFQLFSGLFGASDEVLGTIESGIDFEKRILAIYRNCRTSEAIDAAFQKLQEELRPQIEKGMQNARKTLLDHFDEDVHTRLKDTDTEAKAALDRISNLFWRLSRFMLRELASFHDERLSFELHQPPVETARSGHYELISKQKENVVGDFLYRMSHPLGEWVLDSARSCPTPTSFVRFDLTRYPRKLALVQDLKGKSGWLTLQFLEIQSFDREQFLLFSGVTEDGRSMDQEVCEKLFQCDAEVVHSDVVPTSIATKLSSESGIHLDGTIRRSRNANDQLFHDECERIEKWARDIEEAAELRIKEVKKQIDAVRKRMRFATTADEQLACQREMTDLEKHKKRQRRDMEEIEDQTSVKRDQFIARLENQRKHQHTSTTLFTIRWEVV